MKIAFIGQKGIPAKSGGVEKHVEELASRLAQKGHAVFVYARNNYTDKNLQAYKDVKIIHLPSIATKHLDAISHTFLATCHALTQDYDVVHYHSIGPSALAFLIKLFKRRTAVIATYHCQDYFHQKWGLLARLALRLGEWLTIQVPDLTIVVSKTLRNFVANRFHKYLPVVPNGFAVKVENETSELEKWQLAPQQYILSVSRLIPHKGIHFLIEAFQNLKKRNLHQGKKLVIVGDGYYTKAYERKLRMLAKNDQDIIFTGHQTGLALSELFSHAYLFVQPSESEGLSIALLEALGYGRATLVSDIAENLEVIGSTNFSFANGDTRDLEEKLAYILSQEELAKREGQKGQERAQREYNWDNSVKNIELLYQKVLAEKKR